MKQSYVLAIDQGTTSSRTIIFNHKGEVCASAQQEFEQHFPHPGWVEHDANAIWTSQRLTIQKTLDQIKAQPGQIAAIGITNQRETTVAWNKITSQPLARAIVWQDRRTAAYCDELKQQGYLPMVRSRSGLMLDPYFSGTKMRWLLQNNSQVREAALNRTLAFGTVDSWLLWQLSGGTIHATDASNASRTLLCNLNTAQWDNDLLELFSIERHTLPEIRPSSAEFARCMHGIHPALDGVPITGIAGDQQAALFGQACFTPGMAKNTYGTGCFALINAGNGISQTALNTSQDADGNIQLGKGLLGTVAWQLPQQRQYALEGSVFIGGAVVQWLRDGLGIIQRASDIEALAASVPDSDGVIFVPAFVGLGTPYWDASARGTMVGITRGTTKAHIAHAALEAIALQSTELIQAMSADSGQALTELRVDGGASNNNLLMQMQANLLGIPVLRPKVSETTALGAAYLAGLAVGYWSDLGDIQKNWALDRRFEPQMNATWIEEKLTQWKKAVEKSRN